MPNDADPYDLLRRAREILRASCPQGAHTWLQDYKRLPGATLSKRAVRVLRDPHRLLRQNETEDIIEKLIDEGYLKVVFTHAGKSKQIRRGQKGQAALCLRMDVE